jgi:Protein of unknown function (DUF5672)
MQKLKLPDVTLVMIETRERDLACMAVQDCMNKVEFGEVVIFTDRPEVFQEVRGTPRPRFVVVQDWPDKLGWSRCLWNEVGPQMRTTHWLSIQWDSWVFDPEMWHDENMRYDYIGSPWWYKDGRNVGNGGFSLRSTRLARYLSDHRDEFPCTTNIDDDLLCRHYRPRLCDRGFVWAPQKLAEDFSFELMRPSDSSRHFGFHGMFNWHAVLNQDEIMQRAEVAYRSDYIRARMWNSFLERNPEVAKRFAA